MVDSEQFSRLFPSEAEVELETRAENAKALEQISQISEIAPLWIAASTEYAPGSVALRQIGSWFKISHGEHIAFASKDPDEPYRDDTAIYDWSEIERVLVDNSGVFWLRVERETNEKVGIFGGILSKKRHRQTDSSTTTTPLSHQQLLEKLSTYFNKGRTQINDRLTGVLESMHREITQSVSTQEEFDTLYKKVSSQSE